jgi:tetratricopeptide (TPR) repeat protein
LPNGLSARYHTRRMRWIAVLTVLLFLTGSSRAVGPDDQYLDIYNEILQADNLQQSGHAQQAAARYREAQAALKRLEEEHPNWNTEIVNFRLDYVAEQLQGLPKATPVVPTPPPVAAVPAKTVPEIPNTATEISSLQEQIRSLTAANTELENKLKEALSVQPAAVSPRELAKADERIIALQKEKDLIAVALEQAKTKPQGTRSPEADKTAKQLVDANQALADLKARSSNETKAAQAEMAQLRDALADAQKKIAAQGTQIEALKSSRAGKNSEKDIAAERDKLKEELAARTRDLADAESHRDQKAVEMRAQLAEVERQRDELKAKLAAAPTAAVATTDGQLEQLRSRLAVLEAQAVPYTPEELAVMKKNPPSTAAQGPAPAPEKQHVVHSMKDLPPGAGALMTEAGRAEMERDYPKAAEKYQEILRQDENDVYVLAHLASAQFAMNQLTECEKTVTRALASDPDDSPSLYLLGILRYRQEKLDDALDALSRSAKYNPTNVGTQYYLGRVLEDKGLRAAAETAFRKALQSEPDYADAHYSLACVYVSEKPPSVELARWHYQRAVDLGHGKSKELEKMLAQPQ